MNREDAAREIDNTACCFSDKRFRDAMHMAAAALRGPQPDPITGLVPCGCGGTPEMVTHDGIYHYVHCTRCGTKSEPVFMNSSTKWNTAMGYTAPPRPGAIGPDAGEMAPNGDEGAEL